MSVIKKSTASQPEPDLFLFAVPGFFAGYHPDYARAALNKMNYFTWLILKGHTINRAGRVSLASHNPREAPTINFNYFEKDDDPCCDDLDSVVAGVEFIRKITARTSSLFVEEIPGKQKRSRAQLGAFVRNRAWGHHACGTCQIGADDDEYAVVDSRFKVRGTQRLRVVDASIFPAFPVFLSSAQST